MLLYLHGFRSSPQSFKARLIGARMAQLGRAHEYVCPQLPPGPAEAMALLRRLIVNACGSVGGSGSGAHNSGSRGHGYGNADSCGTDQLTLIGSSLGGYYATALAEETGSRAVLLNPALRAFEKLAAHVGPQRAYHDGGADFAFTLAHLEELRALHVPAITRPERYFLIAATGDELLDWREMADAFPGAQHKIIEGSDHALSDFSNSLDETLGFLGQM